jgi:geranylgeranyl reductase
VVIGGGPAGARSAELLARGGAGVLLLEAEGPDVDNLCSGLLNAEGQHALGCDLPAYVRRSPFNPPLEYHDVDNRLRLGYAPGYWNMDRPLFDAWLRERAADAGATVRYHVRVSRIEAGALPIVHTSDGPIRCQLVVDASGWRALSRRQLGRDRGKAPHVHAFQGIVSSELPEDAMWAVFRSAVTPYYGWLVPKGDGEFLLGAGFPAGAEQTRREDAAGRPESAAAGGDRGWGKLQYLVEHLEGQGAGVRLQGDKPRGCPITTIESVGQLWWGAGNIIAVGEAAGLVSPSSGDGIHFALDHAARLAAAFGECGVHGVAPLSREALERMHVGIRRGLATSLAELRFNCIKSRIAAHPLPRGVAARLLPLYLRRPVRRLAFAT